MNHEHELIQPLSPDGGKLKSISPQPLRARLFTLTASGLLPLIVAVLLGTAYLVHDQRKDAQRSALELSRALATAVEAELKSTVGILQSFALLESIEAIPPEQLHELARRLARQHGWRSIALADGIGRIIWNSSHELGEAISHPLDPASMDLAVVSGGPVIGRVVDEQRLPGSAFSVRVPVMREGRLVNVLSAVVNTDVILKVLTRQNVPSTWIVGVFDQDGTRVARTKMNATPRPSPSMQALLDTGAPEGMGPTYTLEGVPSFSGFSRLKDSGWTVAVAISTAEVQRALLPLLMALVAGLLASLALSAYMAWIYARRVSQPIDALKSAADAMGRGNRVALPRLGISELDEVGTALNLASDERDARRAERRKAELERERLLERLSEALRLAEQAGRGKDQFLALLAHELRNPLAPVRNGVEVLRMSRAAETGPGAELLPMMERQLAHMARLLDDLLDVSRLANGKLELRKEKIDAAQAVRAAVEASKPRIDSMGQQLIVALPAKPVVLDADPVRVAQIVSNLLNNASHYSPPGGHIYLSAARHDDEIRFSVKDNGVGIRPEHLESIFGMFVQVNPRSAACQGGLGIGLSLVRAMAELHGGRVEARSSGPGQGSEFTVRLPVAADGARGAPPSRSEARFAS